ncbi:hypothetical protein KQX54_013208 [Cotesia glomerata]|uniref:Myb/SANT-like DNA-binding domain-containing protein n=1 Tax=Cotesia glomerata TaxID=32391 RepID=A0AAV7IBS2_COTGL|nr:hypothetical protein KQX54_013208 [Cotesia glomerata]
MDIISVKVIQHWSSQVSHKSIFHLETSLHRNFHADCSFAKKLFDKLENQKLDSKGNTIEVSDNNSKDQEEYVEEEHIEEEHVEEEHIEREHVEEEHIKKEHVEEEHIEKEHVEEDHVTDGAEDEGTEFCSKRKRIDKSKTVKGDDSRGKKMKASKTNEDIDWSDPADIKILLVEYGKRLDKFQNAKIKKKTLWQEIVRVFAEYGKVVCYEAISKKFTSMKSTYVEKKRNNDPRRTTGKGRSPWPWFKEMDELFKNDESINFPTNTFASMPSDNTCEPLNLSHSTHLTDQNFSSKSSSNQPPSSRSSPQPSCSSENITNRSILSTSKTEKNSSYYRQKKALIEIGFERNDILKEHVSSQANFHDLYKEGFSVLREFNNTMKERNELLQSMLEKLQK